MRFMRPSLMLLMGFAMVYGCNQDRGQTRENQSPPPSAAQPGPRPGAQMGQGTRNVPPVGGGPSAAISPELQRDGAPQSGSLTDHGNHVDGGHEFDGGGYGLLDAAIRRGPLNEEFPR